MEARGIKVDRQILSRLSGTFAQKAAGLEAEIRDLAGTRDFNPGSPKQLGEILFEKMGLPGGKKTRTGQWSTDARTLEDLAAEGHALPRKIVDWRQLTKLKSTYTDALPGYINADTGRVHTSFALASTTTGRLSSSDPNLQNIPVRTEEGRAIRAAFAADPGNVLLVADYSQIELRILAHLSGDPGLVEAFNEDIDIHTATAARVNHIDAEKVTPDQRRKAKMVNFGLLYGMEAYGLAQRLDISREEAQSHIDEYFAQFPDVQAYLQGVVEQARVDGYTTTLLGRRRYLPELASSRFRDRQAGERMALNAPIQGAAADIIKKAMIDLDSELAGRSAQMLLQIHDELVIELPEDEVDEVAELTRSTMERIVDLDVPLKVEVASGRTLADCKE
jgi:DNA polymerase-1